MKYTEALDAIRADHMKRFSAYYEGLEETLILSAEEFVGENYEIVMTGWGGSTKGYLTFKMMDLDWTEEQAE